MKKIIIILFMLTVLLASAIAVFGDTIGCVSLENPNIHTEPACMTWCKPLRAAGCQQNDPIVFLRNNNCYCAGVNDCGFGSPPGKCRANSCPTGEEPAADRNSGCDSPQICCKLSSPGPTSAVTVVYPEGNYATPPIEVIGIYSATEVNAVSVSIEDNNGKFWDGMSWVNNPTYFPASVGGGIWILSSNIPSFGEGILYSANAAGFWSETPVDSDSSNFKWLNDWEPGGNNAVPEFSTIGLFLTIIIAAIGIAFIMFRKK
jgi:hypothetical protein